MKKILTSLLFLFVIGSAFSQPYKTIKIYKPYKWMFGLHWAAIEDDGNKFSGIFDVGDSWNMLAYPSQFTADRYFNYGWSMEIGATYSKYKLGKLINDSTNYSGTFANLDVNGKYSFYNLYAPKARWVEPYTTFGLGYTYRAQGAPMHSATVNLGVGVNFWVYKDLGIRLQSSAKIGVYPFSSDGHVNYLHHSAGILLRIHGGKSQSDDFGRKKNKWVHKTKGYKEKGGK